MKKILIFIIQHLLPFLATYLIFTISFWFFEVSAMDILVSSIAGGVVFLVFNVVYTFLMRQNLNDNMRLIEKKYYKHPSITGLKAFFKFNLFLVIIGLVLSFLYISYILGLIDQAQLVALSPFSLVFYFSVLFSVSIIDMIKGILKKDFSLTATGWVKASFRSFFHLMGIVVFSFVLQIHFGIEKMFFLQVFLGLMVVEDVISAIVVSRLKALKFKTDKPFWFTMLFYDL
jgi:hypothetical protein